MPTTNDVLGGLSAGQFEPSFQAVVELGTGNVVGAEIRRCRRQLRWSQSRLAKHLQVAGLDLSRSSLAKIECGMVWVGDLELLYFARVLGLRVQDLFPKIAADEPLNGALTTILGISPDALKKKANGGDGATHECPSDP